MTKRLWIATLLSAAVFGSTAHAHGGGRGWDDHRHDRWQHERHDRHHHHHDHWRHRAPPPPAWGYAPAYRPAPPAYPYDYRPVITVPLPPLLPPTPWEVHRAVRDSLFGRY